MTAEPTVIGFTALVALIALQRLLELRLAERNARAAVADIWQVQLAAVLAIDR